MRFAQELRVCFRSLRADFVGLLEVEHVLEEGHLLVNVGRFVGRINRRRIAVRDVLHGHVLPFAQVRVDVNDAAERDARLFLDLGAVEDFRTCRDEAARLAANLGIAFAEEGHRVIIVDADARSPYLGSVLGVDRSAAGLAAAISNPALNLSSLLVDGPHTGIRLLLSESPSAGSPWLKSDTIKNLVRRLKGMSDTVILVVPPITSSSSALLWIAAADRALLAVSVGKTRTTDLQETTGSVQLAGTLIVGTALIEPGGGIPSFASRLH